MDMKKWAEKEIEIACKRERNGNETPEGEWDYGCACYQSALKAFNSLMEDGHSGFSISLTKNILNRLIEGKPLTEIEDTDDVWYEVGGYDDEEKGIKHYQCNRMSSLFKDVYPDGRIEYHDVDRARGCDIYNESYYYSNGLISRYINEKYPITMPYTPPSKPYVMYSEDFLVDPDKGDYDTKGFYYLITPEGEKVTVNKFYHEFEKGEPMKEISKEKYEKFKKKANRITKDKNNHKVGEN